MNSTFSFFVENPMGEPDHSFDGVEYEDRVVAFIDLLGWRNLVEETQDSKLAVSHLGFVLGLFGKPQSGEPWMPPDFLGHVPPSFQATQFSDTIVLSWLYRPGIGTTAAISIDMLYASVLNYGLLLRGSVVRGPVFHRPGLLFGPALAAAYDLERKHAIYPRIILAEDLAAEFGRGADHVDDDGRVSAVSKSWRSDVDGRSFYDFVQPFNAMQKLLPTAPEWGHSMDFFSKYEAVIGEGLYQFSGSPHELRKYVWLAAYYNDVIAEYPMKKTRPIDVSGFPSAYEEVAWKKNSA